jgi:hypothetical protein
MAEPRSQNLGRLPGCATLRVFSAAALDLQFGEPILQGKRARSTASRVNPRFAACKKFSNSLPKDQFSISNALPGRPESVESRLL